MTFTRFRSAEKIRRQSRSATLVRRDDAVLPFLRSPEAGTAILPDTCVYIDQMQGRAPEAIEDLLSIRIVHHSIVAVQELMHAVGMLDPKDGRSRPAIQAIEAMVDAMPSHRILVPDADVLAGAAVQAGILARLQGYAKDDHMGALQDCILFQQALKSGFVVLTSNLRVFDLLLQMQPAGRVIFYRA